MFPCVETLEALRWFDSISDVLPVEGREHLKTLRLAVFAQQQPTEQSTPCSHVGAQYFGSVAKCHLCGVIYSV